MDATGVRAINEAVIGTPEKRAADAAVLRGQILRAVRRRRHLKPIEATRSRADRLQRVAKALNELRSEHSARRCAEILKRRGLFSDVEADTLRKDIAAIRKLARSS